MLLLTPHTPQPVTPRDRSKDSTDVHPGTRQHREAVSQGLVGATPVGQARQERCHLWPVTGLALASFSALVTCDTHSSLCAVTHLGASPRPRAPSPQRCCQRPSLP